MGFVLLVTGTAAADEPDLSWLPQAPPLGAPQGPVIRVQGVDSLFAAVAGARPGTTILLADGRYFLPSYLDISTDNLTLRSESGDRHRVILSGAHLQRGELLGISGCSGVTIADLTVENVMFNGIKLNSDTGVHRATIRNCVIHNVWQRGVKGVNRGSAPHPSQCVVEYCLFYNDRRKLYPDDPTDTPDSFKGNYIAGIDIMFADRWSIRDNVFLGIRGRSEEGRAAIFLWRDSRDCVVERNIIIDCDAGISLGNAAGPGELKVHCTGSIARNNFITRAHEGALFAAYTQDCRLVNNTVFDPENPYGRSIRATFVNHKLLVAGNLIAGRPVQRESGGEIEIRDNLVGVSGDLFIDPLAGDLHLKADAAAAIDKGPKLEDVSEDIDRRHRDDRPDFGAHEAASEK